MFLRQAQQFDRLFPRLTEVDLSQCGWLTMLGCVHISPLHYCALDIPYSRTSLITISFCTFFFTVLGNGPCPVRSLKRSLLVEITSPCSVQVLVSGGDKMDTDGKKCFCFISVFRIRIRFHADLDPGSQKFLYGSGSRGVKNYKTTYTTKFSTKFF